MPYSLVVRSPKDKNEGEKIFSETLVTIYQTVRRQSKKKVIFIVSALRDLEGLATVLVCSFVLWSTSLLPHRAPCLHSSRNQSGRAEFTRSVHERKATLILPAAAEAVTNCH
jgi:hypothetical protein